MAELRQYEGKNNNRIRRTEKVLLRFDLGCQKPKEEKPFKKATLF
jgi:hypothetical protein